MPEFKKYGLRATRRPHNRAEVSSAVLYVRADGSRGYCYVTFTEELVKAVGKKLPRGVAPYDPAHLMAVYDNKTQAWRIFAVYVRDAVHAFLWSTKEKPDWLNVGAKNGNNEVSAPAPGPRTDPTGAPTSPGKRRGKA